MWKVVLIKGDTANLNEVLSTDTEVKYRGGTGSRLPHHGYEFQSDNTCKGESKTEDGPC